jgi:hypothetical protein
MSGKVIVPNKGGAITETAGFNLKLPEGMDPAEYTKILDDAREQLQITNQTIKQAYGDAMPRVYDVGKALLGLEKRIPTFTDKCIAQIAMDLDQTAEARPYTMKILRTGMRVAKLYTRERLVSLAQGGVTDSHFSVIAQIEDGRSRHAVEEKVIKQGLSVKETMKEVSQLSTTKGEGVLSPASQKRRKQAKTVQGNKREKRISKPDKQFAYMLGKIQQVMDDVGDTFMALKGIEKVDAADRPALLPTLNELTEKFGNLSQTVKSILEESKKAVQLCKVADKK